jgi:hypothetical protein
LTAHLEKIILSEKMIEEDLSRVEESATKSTYRLGVVFERCEKKGEKSAPKFVASSSYHKEEEALKPTKAHYPFNPKPSFNPKKDVKREPPSREMMLLFACFVAVRVIWMSFAFDERELRRDTMSIDEDINTSAIIISSIEILGPITRSRAQQLNRQVNSFLCSSAYNIESRLLPNDLIVF